MARVWTAAQEAAMTLSGKTLLVSAAAGSGKTSVLTERIIRSLTDREHPADLSRLLVVTFTRAAAAELKARIATALTEALAEDPSNKHLSKQLLLLGSAQISTIDSFFQKIVRANFEQLGLPASFRIADENEVLPISLEILDGLIEEFYLKYSSQNGTDALDRIVSNRFAEAMDNLLSNRSDGKLDLLLLDFLQSFSSYPEGIGLLNQCADELRESADREFLETRQGQALSVYLEELFRGYLDELVRLENELEFDPDIALKCGGILSSDIAYCNAMLSALEKKCYEKVRAVAFSFLTGRFPTIKNKPPQVAAYQGFRTVFRKEIASKVQEKLQWPATQVSWQIQRTAELCEMLYDFFSEYEKRIMAEKNARGILEYNDVRAMLYKLLSDQSGASTDFASSLASQYDAVYIDEYQDVDLLQDRIFSLIGEDRRFMVGDIKQSIYGFRGSDPSIFASYRRAMPLHTDPAAADANGICVFMSENFRCDRPVIDFANRICGFLFSACEKSVGYRSQDDLVCSKRPPEGVESPAFSPVEVAVFEAKPKSEEAVESGAVEDDSSTEAVWVAAEISRLLHEGKLDDGAPIAPADIAILVRAKAQGEEFAKELEALNIPVAADVSNDFLHQPLMTDVLNLLRAIDNPYRDLPLSEFLLSPIGAFTLEELTEIRESAPHHKALYDAMEERAKQEDALGEKTLAFLEWAEALREQASVLAADRFLRLLYLDEKLISYGNDPILLFLYEQARIWQKTSWCSLYGFLGHIDKLLDGKQVSAAGFCKAESAVTIMTVHHSKGLEFPVVFLASCGSPFNRSDTRETLLFHRNAGCATKLYDCETGESQNTILREIVKQEIDAEQTEESIRTLYVALTRARERLYLTATMRGKLENAIATASTVHRGNRSSILSCNSYLSWILAARQEAESQKAEFPCTFRYILPQEVSRGRSFDAETSTEATRHEAPENSSDTLAAHYARISCRQASFDYPLSCLHGLPTKAAASKLRPNLLDILNDEDAEAEALETQIELMRAATPSFDRLLEDRAKASAADIGTATHAFLEFCDFKRLATHGIESERVRLLENKFITKETDEIIHQEQLELFGKSNLLQWIFNAKKVYREQKFGLFVPYSSLTENQETANALQGHHLFVQGSIDLLLQMPDDSLYLIDYKTDRITEEERKDTARLQARMRQAHGTQLSYYAQAVKELFGKTPDKIFIYSLPLGSAIEI